MQLNGNHNHDYKCVFSCHLPIDKITGTERQRNPWSLVTMSPRAIRSYLVKSLGPEGLQRLILTETGYRSEHLVDRGGK